MKAAPPECKEQGLLAPVIDRNRCEGKEDCVRVCPYDVFAIGTLSEAERAALSFKGRMKAFFHGNRQAFAVRAENCHGCGLCVEACPEKAIGLARSFVPGSATG
ncbi:MAG TPA: ferredoxin family protein [Polyangiaceae bacterium]|nr:ferredoxin family protein [Polyangiaceae bacterium]